MLLLQPRPSSSFFLRDFARIGKGKSLARVRPAFRAPPRPLREEARTDFAAFRTVVFINLETGARFETLDLGFSIIHYSLRRLLVII